MNPLSIDLEEFLTALSWGDDVYSARNLLNRKTGALVLLSDDFTDDELPSDFDGNSPDWIDIDPLDSSETWGWMEDFIGTPEAAALRDRLSRALHGKKPFRHFKDVLLDDPSVRDAWFAFEQVRLKEAAEAWCREQDIEPRWT